MRIIKVEAFSISVPYRLKTAIASGEIPDRSGQVVVRIRTDEGLVGIAEVGPLYAHFSTKEEVLGAINGHLIPTVLGEDPFDIAMITARMDRAIPHNTYAKSAIDLALWDLMGKALNVPVYRLLGGKRLDRVPLVWTIFLGEPKAAAAEASRMKAEGFRSFKVKVGIDVRSDVERTSAVREAIGNDCHLWVDANQGYTVKDAIRFARAVERCDLVAFEQPVARYNLTGLAEVSHAVSIPVMTDESSHTPEQVIELIRRQAVHMFSHKISRSGGLYRSRQMLAIAEAAAMPVILAASTGSCSTAAGAHLYAASPVIRYGAELVPPLWLERTVREGDLQIQGGELVVPEGPGLGVTLDEEAIECYRDP